MVANKVTK